MQRPEHYDELTEIMGALCDEAATDVQLSRLNEILERDAGARRLYMMYVDLHAGLSRQSIIPQSIAPSIRSVSPARWKLFPHAVLAVAALIVIAVGLAMLLPGFGVKAPAPEVAVSESYTSGIALLKRVAGTVFRENTALMAGDVLSPGTYRIETGAAEIQLYSGVSVVLDTSTHFTLTTNLEMACQTGRLRVDIPPQVNGFRLLTPHFRILDRGTKFGVALVGEQADIHVFDGEVELEAGSVSFSRIKAGEAVNVLQKTETRRHSANESLFLTVESLKNQVLARDAKSLNAWKSTVPSKENDPSLLAHFDFENLASDSTMLVNRATDDPALSGIIVGCSVEQGRWPEKGALAFEKLGDRVRVRIPGSYRSLSMTAWVRIDELDRAHNALFMSDAFGPGSIHWQIQNTGNIELSIAGQAGGLQPVSRYVSPVALTELIGRWVHLAVVYDSESGVVVHYVNGKPLSKREIKMDALLFPGSGELGNWNPLDHQDRKPIRFLRGRMDDFAVYARALTNEDVRNLFKKGGVQHSPPLP